MARPIKHACAICGYPRWRHVGDARQPKTCEKFAKAKGAKPPAEQPLKTGDERVETPTCPEPMTGGE